MMNVEMPFIQKGHDPGACYWLMPVRCHSSVCFGWDSIEECKAAEISLNEFDAVGLLSFFFEKYFDSTLVYNQQRRDDVHGIDGLCFPATFESYLTHNFYSYDSIRAMLGDLSKVVNTLEDNGLDSVPPELSKEIKTWFYLGSSESADQAADETLAPTNLGIILEYYRAFISQMEKMLSSHPAWPLISIMGP